MPVTLVCCGVQFPDSTVQCTAAGDPTGTIMYSTANTPPAGYVCTNAVYSQSAYPNLYCCVGLISDNTFCCTSFAYVCTSSVCQGTNGWCCLNTTFPGYCPALQYNSAGMMLGNAVKGNCRNFDGQNLIGYPNMCNSCLNSTGGQIGGGCFYAYQIVNPATNTTWFSCTQKAMYVSGIEMYCCTVCALCGPWYYYLNFRTLCTASPTCPSSALCLNKQFVSSGASCCFNQFGNVHHRLNGLFKFSINSSGPALASDRKCRAIFAFGPQLCGINTCDVCNCPFSAGCSCSNFLYFYTNDGGVTLNTCTNICCLTTAYLTCCSINSCFVECTPNCGACNFVPLSPLAFYNAKCDNFIMFPFVAQSCSCVTIGVCTVMQSCDLICWCAAAITASICNLYCNCSSSVTWSCSVGLHCCFWNGLLTYNNYYMGPGGINTCYDTVSNCIWIWTGRGYSTNCWIYSFDPSTCCMIGYQLVSGHSPVQVWNGCLIADSYGALQGGGNPSPLQCQLYIYNLSCMTTTNMVTCQYTYTPRLGFGGSTSFAAVNYSPCCYALTQWRMGALEFGGCNTKVGNTYFGSFGSVTCDGITYFNSNCWIPSNSGLGNLYCTQIPCTCTVSNPIFTNQYLIYPTGGWNSSTGISISPVCYEFWTWFSLYKYNSSTQFRTPSPGVAIPVGYNSFIKT